MSSSTWLQYVTMGLMVLLVLASTAAQIAGRLRVGPVRFRLPLASLANPPTDRKAYRVVLGLAALGTLPIAIIGADPSIRALPLLYLCLWLNDLQINGPRRDARRWLVLASGLVALASGALMLAIASRHPHGGAAFFGVWFPLVFAVFFIGAGLPTTHEFVAGTRVCEGGIEMFASAQPWSRIAIQGWEQREGDLMLRLRVHSPRLGGLRVARDGEVVVPVPASERPALEDFLARHVPAAA
jgi:hypothetical protein